jgi:hypothetical protein
MDSDSLQRRNPDYKFLIIYTRKAGVFKEFIKVQVPQAPIASVGLVGPLKGT